MSKLTHPCLTCALAKWDTTSAGRLHPSGDGRCGWKMPEVPIPSSFYYLGRDREVPEPMGGSINRHTPEKDCPCYQPNYKCAPPPHQSEDPKRKAAEEASGVEIGKPLSINGEIFKVVDVHDVTRPGDFPTFNITAQSF